MRRTQAVHVTSKALMTDSLFQLLTTTGRATAVCWPVFKDLRAYGSMAGAAWLGLAWRGTQARLAGVAWSVWLGSARQAGMGSGFGSGPLLWDTEDTENEIEG